MKGLHLTFPDWLRARFTDSQRFLILCVLAGLCCGLAAVAFHLAIHEAFHHVWHWMVWLEASGYLYLVPLIPMAGGLLTGVLLQKCAPSAVGSGIPQTKFAFYNNFGVIPLKEAAWRFVLGTIYVGSGNALGREGPTVHMCAAIASKLAAVFGLAKARIQAMVPVGMAAGIAAAFNAPLSAILFVFEELLDDFSTKALAGIVVAVVIAAAVSRMILGEEPVLHVDLGSDIRTAPWMLVALPIGLLSALIGHVYVRMLLRLRLVSRQLTLVPNWVKPGIGGLVTGVVATLVWQYSSTLGEAQNGVFSIGYNSLEAAFDARLLGVVMLVLFIGKFVATLFGYATGGSGGLFSPTLFLGGMLGGALGEGLTGLQGHVNLFWGTADTHIIGACVLLGMGAMFASIIRCPFTR